MAKWRRGHAGGHVGPLAQAWGELVEEQRMAQAGGTTTAYRCKVIDGVKLTTMHDPKLRTECATVDDAMLRLQRGETVTVAGSDMGQLRSRLAGLGVRQVAE